MKHFGRVNLNFKSRGLTAEIIPTSVAKGNFSEDLCLLRQIGPCKEHWRSLNPSIVPCPLRSFSVSLSLANAKVSTCPTSRMALYMNFLCSLAGRALSKTIGPGTFVLSPGSPFSPFLSSFLLPSQASQHSSGRILSHCREQPSSPHSLSPTVFSRKPPRGASLTYSWPHPLVLSLTFPLFLFFLLHFNHWTCVTQPSPLCPTLVHQKSGPFSQP